jgi:hypothetical protein
MTSSKTSKFILFGIAGSALILGLIFWNHSHGKEDRVYVEVKPIQTSNGWGYNILTDGKIYIHQEYIPAVVGRRAFKTKEDALKVGRKVISKLSTRQMPTISIDELREMGIVIDSMAER